MEFPFFSLCGKERNYVRIDDCPFVFTHVTLKEVEGTKKLHLAYNNADELLTMEFQPEKIFMLPETGRVYHPAPQRAGSIGLIRSKLAIEFSKYFQFDNGENDPPTQFTYDGVLYNLDTSWYFKAVENQFSNLKR